jgi:hypothetical protein
MVSHHHDNVMDFAFLTGISGGIGERFNRARPFSN